MVEPIKKHLLNLGKTTSVKGIGKVIKSDQNVLKILWLLSVIIGGSVAVYMVSIYLVSYFKYETTTKMSYCDDCHPPFPDVTVCNINPLSLIANYPDDLATYADYITRLDQYHATPFTNRTFFEETLDLQAFEIYGAMDAIYSLKGYFMNLRADAALELIASAEDGLILDCNWFDWLNGPFTSNENCINLTRRNVIYINDYFICNTFHLNESQSQQVKGLEAVLYLNDFSNDFMLRYHQNLLGSQASGARLLIHAPGTYPEMSKGFNIPPENEVTVQLKAMKMIRKEEPYSTCTHKEWQDPSDDGEEEWTDLFRRYKYDNGIASSVCKQEFFINNCGCYHPSYPITKYIIDKYPFNPFTGTIGCGTIANTFGENGPAEGILDTTVQIVNHTVCYLYNKMNAGAGKIDIEELCNFDQSCNEYKYEHSISSSPWPHEAYQIAFFCKYIAGLSDEKDCENINTTRYNGKFDVYINISAAAYSLNTSHQAEAVRQLHNLNLLQSNFIQLKIFFPEVGITEYEDSPTVTLERFFGTMGGMLNLWIGITFFTLIELFDFLYILVSDLFCSKKSVTKVEEMHPPRRGFFT